MKAIAVGVGVLGAILLGLVALGTVVQVVILGPVRDGVPGPELWAIRGLVGVFSAVVGLFAGHALHAIGAEVLAAHANRREIRTQHLRAIEAELDAELHGASLPEALPGSKPMSDWVPGSGPRSSNPEIR